MTYTAPALLLVGAANALVQVNDVSLEPNCVVDNPDDLPRSDYTELW